MMNTTPENESAPAVETGDKSEQELTNTIPTPDEAVNTSTPNESGHDPAPTLFAKGPTGGFVKSRRSYNAAELLRNDPEAFQLLTLIAWRTRWNDALIDTRGLEVGQSFVGDYKNAGIPTERRYRTALKHLREYGIVETKATNNGTIVTLLDTSIYDPYPDDRSDEQNADQATNRRRPSDEQATNKRRLTKPGRTEKLRNTEVSQDDPLALAKEDAKQGSPGKEVGEKKDHDAGRHVAGGQVVPKGVRL
jgi:hypothetical protein